MPNHFKRFHFNTIGVKNMFQKEMPNIEYLINNFIIKNGLTYIAGPSGSFKTGIMIYAAINGALGRDVLHFSVNKPFKTLLIDEENGERNTRYRLRTIINGAGIDINNLQNEDFIISCISGFKLSDAPIDYIQPLRDIIKKNNIDLVIIDNIARCLMGSERDEKDVAKILAFLKPIMEDLHVSFVVIHHTRKGTPSSLDDISGSRDFGAQTDNAFILTEEKKNRTEESKQFRIRHVKDKFGVNMKDTYFNVNNLNELGDIEIEYAGSSEDLDDKFKIALREINVFLETSPRKFSKRKDIIDYVKTFKVSTSMVDKTLKWGVENGRFAKKYGEYCLRNRTYKK